MGFLADAYKWVDANLLGGVLPGGHPISAPGATIGGVVPTPFVGIQPAAAPAPFVAAPAPFVGAPTLFGGGGAVQQAAMGMPVVAPRPAAMPRGRTVTAVARVLPNGQVIPVRMMPGRCIVTTADLQTVKRVKKAMKLLNRSFPKPRKKRRRYAPARRSSGKK